MLRRAWGNINERPALKPHVLKGHVYYANGADTPSRTTKGVVTNATLISRKKKQKSKDLVGSDLAADHDLDESPEDKECYMKRLAEPL